MPRCHSIPAAYPDLQTRRATSWNFRSSVPIWPCSGGGLACHACRQARGALLPHLFTLTRTLSGRNRCTELSGSPVRQSRKPGGTFSVPLSLGAPFRRPRLPLATLLLNGARTFLSPSRASDCLDHNPYRTRVSQAVQSPPPVQNKPVARISRDRFKLLGGYLGSTYSLTSSSRMVSKRKSLRARRYHSSPSRLLPRITTSVPGCTLSTTFTPARRSISARRSLV